MDDALIRILKGADQSEPELGSSRILSGIVKASRTSLKPEASELQTLSSPSPSLPALSPQPPAPGSQPPASSS